jgi:uroporphyrinogen-III decarboxylase
MTIDNTFNERLAKQGLDEVSDNFTEAMRELVKEGSQYLCVAEIVGTLDNIKFEFQINSAEGIDD